MAMGLAKQIGASITGNVEQAYLVISDYRQKCSGKSGGKSAEISSMNTFRKMEIVAKTTPYPGMPKTPANAVPKFGYNEKTFKVQFNPSQLMINASNVPVKKPDALGSGPAQNAVTKARLTMTATLYFDEMNVYDSFMWDKYSSMLTATAQNVKNKAAALASAGGKIWTVQNKVEGLVSALRNPLTRNISFRWANFTFSGQLSNISAQYTMFSTSGRPVRAKVTLRIQHEMDDNYLSNWYKDYETAFGSAQKSLTGASQKVGNLLNLSL